MQLFLLLNFILLQLGKHKEALDFACAAQQLDPSGSDVAERIESVKKDLAAGFWFYLSLTFICCTIFSHRRCFEFYCLLIVAVRLARTIFHASSLHVSFLCLNVWGSTMLVLKISDFADYCIPFTH